MHTDRNDDRLSATEHAALFEAARQRALQARREAIDEFWCAVGRAAGHALAAWRRTLDRMRPGHRADAWRSRARRS